MIEMTLDIADGAAKAALGKARQMGAALSVSIVDEAGRTVLAMRADGAESVSVAASRAKAVTAANIRRWTSGPLAKAEATAAFGILLSTVLDGDFMGGLGGVPILRDGHIIGAIGCDGGTGEQDLACAAAGAHAAEARSALQ